MISTKKIALLVDVDNVKIGGEAFNELYAKLNEIGDVVYCKFYGYNDRKHIYLSDAIAKFGYETAPFMRYKKRFSQLDSRMIVDALKLNYTKTEIDTYCIVAGDGDLIPLLVELKTSGRTLIDINTPYQEQNYHMFDAHLNLETLSLEAETYKPKTRKKRTTTATPKASEKPVQTAVEPPEEVVVETPKVVEVETPRQVVVEAPSERLVETKTVVEAQSVERVEETYTAPTMVKPTEQPTETSSTPVIEKKLETYLAPKVEEKEEVVLPKDVDEENTYNLEEIIAPKPVKAETPVEEKAPVIEKPAQESVQEEPAQSVDDKLGEVLRDITNRYAELDFETNDDMDKKLQLIKDIENFIHTETSRGAGLNSPNEEVRQIFAELSGIVDDMKNAI